MSRMEVEKMRGVKKTLTGFRIGAVVTKHLTFSSKESSSFKDSVEHKKDLSFADKEAHQSFVDHLFTIKGA